MRIKTIAAGVSFYARRSTMPLDRISKSSSPSSGAAAPVTTIAQVAPRESPQWAASWISYALLAGGFATIVFMAYSVYLVYSPLHWVDQWSFIQELVGNHGHYSAALCLWRLAPLANIWIHPLPKLYSIWRIYFGFTAETSSCW